MRWPGPRNVWGGVSRTFAPNPNYVLSDAPDPGRKDWAMRFMAQSTRTFDLFEESQTPDPGAGRAWPVLVARASG